MGKFSFIGEALESVSRSKVGKGINLVGKGVQVASKPVVAVSKTLTKNTISGREKALLFGGAITIGAVVADSVVSSPIEKRKAKYAEISSFSSKIDRTSV